MNCPDCGRPMAKSMDNLFQYFTCSHCGVDVIRNSWGVMGALWIKKQLSSQRTSIFLSHETLRRRLKELEKEKDRQQEAEKPFDVGDIRINEYSGKPEICAAIEFLTKPNEINYTWVDYTADLLYHTLGMCPGCGEIYSLTKFKQKAWEEAKKISMPI